MWIDILGSDDQPSAYLRSAEFDDPRVTYYWDHRRRTGIEWQEVLGFNSVAWDIYFLYERDTKWGAIPSHPDYWMHQLGGEELGAPYLNGDLLSEKLAEMLNDAN